MAVQRVSERKGEFTVYNLEVEGTHTYFAGRGRWWVHNACAPKHDHHITPKYLGGPPDGPTGRWDGPVHEQFHEELDRVFPRWQKGSPFQGLDPDLRDEILEELYKHYPPFDDWAGLWPPIARPR